MDSKYTVCNKAVEDSLIATKRYRDRYRTMKPVVSGGIADQLYTHPYYPELMRPTHDLDLIVYPRLSAETFRNDFGKNLADLLPYYNPEISVLRHVFEVKINENEDHFFIHSYKWTENGWNRQKKNIERQIANASPINIPNTKHAVYVVRPEDIIAGKLSRLDRVHQTQGIHIDMEYNYYTAIERNWNLLDNNELQQWLSSLKKQKSALPSFYDRGKDAFIRALDDYVVSKDLFDISLIVRLASEKKIEFDEKYLDHIVEEIE
jgi:hypothetical protein